MVLHVKNGSNLQQLTKCLIYTLVSRGVQVTNLLLTDYVRHFSRLPDQLPTRVTNTRDARDARDASGTKNVGSRWDMYVRGRAEMLV